jgi:hypothetical protein
VTPGLDGFGEHSDGASQFTHTGACGPPGGESRRRNRTHTGPRTAVVTQVASQVAKAVTALLSSYLHRLSAEGRGRRSHPHFVPVERFSATRLLAKVTKRDEVVDDLNPLSKSLSPATNSASGPKKASAIGARSTKAYSGIGGGGGARVDVGNVSNCLRWSLSTDTETYADCSSFLPFALI